ncbi:MAG: right-handed parallel beta-helix repeat-containing protein, partial [Kiritimatiellales bacterium]
MFKRVVAVLFSFTIYAGALTFVVCVDTQTYYIDPSVSSSGTGTTTNSPLKYWSDVTWANGATYLQKRDTTAYEMVEITENDNADNITIGAYGTGNTPPVINGGVDYVNRTWTAYNTTNYPNVYYTPHDGGTRFVGTLVVDEECQENTGYPEVSVGALNNDLEFWISSSTGRIYLYCSQGNPSAVYDKIMLADKKQGIRVTGQSGVTVKDIHVKMTYAGGIDLYHCDNFLIENCIVSYLGGFLNSPPDGRAGNGIDVYNGNSNGKIVNNLCYQIWDWGIAVEHWDDSGSGNSTNILIANNVIQLSGGGIEVAALSGQLSGIISDVVVSNNVVFNSGYGWAGATGNLHGRGISALGVVTGEVLAPCDNLTVVDNMVDGFRSYGIKMQDCRNINV